MDKDSDSVYRVPFQFGGDGGSGVYENDDENESSEDELDIILHGTPEQKRRLTRSLSRGSLQMSSSEDDFEKEMQQELDATMESHERQFMADVEKRLVSGAGPSGGTAAALTSGTGSETAASSHSQHISGRQECYDDVYFDSDDEEGGGSKVAGAERPAASKGDEGGKKQHHIPSNDDLLYDPNIDDDNQNWMDKQRAQYYPKKGAKRSRGQDSSSRMALEDSKQPSQTAESESAAASKSQPSIPKTDAILNCPACMTTLCIDCQRHELYTNQYRAMFVMNCCIIRSEQLKYPVSKKKRKWRKKRKHDDEDEDREGTEDCSSTDEMYNPVKCSMCNTEVAVLDKNEIFHFFNVLSSAA